MLPFPRNRYHEDSPYWNFCTPEPTEAVGNPVPNLTTSVNKWTSKYNMWGAPTVARHPPVDAPADSDASSSGPTDAPAAAVMDAPLVGLIHHYLMERDDAMVRILLEHGANPNVADQHGNTPVFLAASNGDHAILRLLVSRGANVNVIDEFVRQLRHHFGTISCAFRNSAHPTRTMCYALLGVRAC